VENLLFYPFVEVIRHLTHKHARVKLLILLAGIRLSNCMEMEVDLPLPCVSVFCPYKFH
jgi:hypothetical protein